MITFATTTDLTGGTTPWLPSAPSNAANLLRWASILVAHATNRDLVTPPTGQDVQVLTDATCAQVAAWVALGVDPAKAGTDFPAPVKAAKVLSGDYTRDTSSQTKAIADAANGLCDMATSILQAGGLLWLPTALGDPAPYLLDYGLGGPCLPIDGSQGLSLEDWMDLPAAVDAEIDRLLG